MELADALNEVLSGKWRNLRGLEIVSFGVSSVKASEEDEQMLKEMQRNAAFMDPTRAAAHLVGAQAAAMQSAASNQGRRPRDGVHGHEYGGPDGRHERAGALSDGRAAASTAARSRSTGSARERLDVQLRTKRYHRKFLPELRQQKPEPKPAAGSWKCPQCGATATGKFCPECGTKSQKYRQTAGRAAAAR